MEWSSSRRRAARPGDGMADPGAESLRAPVSRRGVITKVAGLAAVGTAGAAILTDALAQPASAATTVESGAIAPAVVMLTDGAAIAVDASAGNDFRVTIAGNRTLENPTNPSDGQKIVFQVTQGSGGSFALSYGNAYEFGAGLPQPTLSTTAGDTDLLGFIYNASKAKWLLVACMTGYTTVAQTQPTGTYRLYPSTNGPSTPVTGYTGPFLAGVVFEVTTGGGWLEGFWWWVCPTAQSTAPQTFALWQPYSLDNGALIAGSTVTSGGLTPGQWNYVALTAPVPLAIGVSYIAATGFNNAFPITNNQFGSGDPFSTGITQGPLFAYSDQSGSAPAPFTMPQTTFSTAGSDPTANMPNGGSGSANFWLDVQVSTTAPAGASYRLWPNYPMIPATDLSNDTGQQTMGTEFLLAEACTLDSIWFYSPPGVNVLPSQCAIWNVATQSVVAGTNNTSPSWSGAAGSGWVSCAYTGVTLPAGDYKTSVYYGGGSPFYAQQANYFSGGGPASAAGIVNGPLTAPNAASASAPGQATYQDGAFAYPDTAGADNGKTRWVDVQVTPT